MLTNDPHEDSPEGPLGRAGNTVLLPAWQPVVCTRLAILVREEVTAGADTGPSLGPQRTSCSHGASVLPSSIRVWHKHHHPRDKDLQALCFKNISESTSRWSFGTFLRLCPSKFQVKSHSSRFEKLKTLIFSKDSNLARFGHA